MGQGEVEHLVRNVQAGGADPHLGDVLQVAAGPDYCRREIPRCDHLITQNKISDQNLTQIKNK